MHTVARIHLVFQFFGDQAVYSGGHGDLEWGEKQAGPGPLPALLKWSAEGGGILPDFCGGMNP